MGSISYYCDKKNILSEAVNRYTHCTDKEEYKVLKSRKIGNHIYLAVEHTNCAMNTRSVFGAVVLTSYHKGECSFKEMEENMHPYYYDCPASILNLLTPTPNSNALEWREKCWKYIGRKKKLSTLKDGDVIEFNSPVSFTDGTSHSRMVVRILGKTRYFCDEYLTVKYKLNEKSLLRLMKWD